MKVICTLPNASEEISGVKFQPHPDGEGMVSEDISQEQAEQFASIDGYKIVGAKPALTDEQKAEAERAAADLAAAVEKATALGVAVKGNWKIERIQVEIEKAERTAADAAAAAAAAAADAGNETK